MSLPPPQSERTPDGRSRRLSGARVPLTEPVMVLAGPQKLAGWVLNLSRGGLRAVLDEEIERDTQVTVFIGDEQTHGQCGRVAWARQRPDGTIVGVAFDTPLPQSAMPTDDNDDHLIDTLTALKDD